MPLPRTPSPTCSYLCMYIAALFMVSVCAHMDICYVYLHTLVLMSNFLWEMINIYTGSWWHIWKSSNTHGLWEQIPTHVDLQPEIFSVLNMLCAFNNLTSHLLSILVLVGLWGTRKKFMGILFTHLPWCWHLHINFAKLCISIHLLKHISTDFSSCTHFSRLNFKMCTLLCPHVTFSKYSISLADTLIL